MSTKQPKEPDVVYKYKKEQWYGVSPKYWLGGGLLVTVIICVYLAMRLYGQNGKQSKDSLKDTDKQSQAGGIPLYANAPPMPTGGVQYSPDHKRAKSLANSPVSTNIENMAKRDLINNVPVYSSHLAQFESQYQPQREREQTIKVQEATPESIPVRRPESTQPVSNDSTNKSPSSPSQGDSGQLPTNKEGGGEGIPLPPVDYSQLQEDAF